MVGDQIGCSVAALADGRFVVLHGLQRYWRTFLINANGDKMADFEIELSRFVKATSSDFVL